MTATAQAVVPAHVPADGRQWTVERAWPAAPGIALEVSGGARTHRRGGLLHDDGTVMLHPAGTDPRLPGLHGVAADGIVVSHRAGRRAVVQSAAGDRFTKVVRPGRGRRLLTSARAAEPLAPYVRLPDVVDAGDDRLVLGALAGCSLLQLADIADEQDWATAWTAWADAWVGIGRDVDPTTISTTHDAHDELTVLRSWQERARHVLDDDAERRLGAAVDSVGRRLLDGRPSPLVACHRDLHDQQVLWDPDAGIGLLDVDTLTVGEAALDLGNLRGHVHFRARQGLYSPRRAETARGRIDLAASTLGVSDDRIVDHELATLVRLVCVYAFRPRWRSAAVALLDELT